MNTTVTMSLERYKELESKEISLTEILNNPEKTVIKKVSYGYGEYCIPISMNDSLKELDEQIRKTDETAEHWRIKAGGK